MTAQGELRGPRAGSLPSNEPEHQFAGGDAAALAGTSEQAARLVARREYMARLAALDLQEVWELQHPEGDHVLVGYRKAHTGERHALERVTSSWAHPIRAAKIDVTRWKWSDNEPPETATIMIAGT